MHIYHIMVNMLRQYMRAAGSSPAPPVVWVSGVRYRVRSR
jgi:hypothetical protein